MAEVRVAALALVGEVGKRAPGIVTGAGNARKAITACLDSVRSTLEGMRDGVEVSKETRVRLHDWLGRALLLCQGKPGEFVAAQQTLEELQKLLDRCSSTSRPKAGLEIGAQVCRIMGNRELGYELGRLAKGTQVLIQYKQGCWKSEGHFPTSSPDDAAAAESCRLAVCDLYEGKRRVLKVVPVDTKLNHFRWTAESDYERVALCMNDRDGSFLNNPDLLVEYWVHVVPPRDVR
jgi:hypothetical protein